jgi:hypothetical protein
VANPAGVGAPGTGQQGGLIRNTGNNLVSEEAKSKYSNIFKELVKSNPQFLSANEAAVYFNRSGLSGADLQKIWLLADQNKDNLLDFDEFVIANVLIQQRVANPNSALPDVLPPGFLSSLKPPGPIPNPTTTAVQNWLIAPEAKLKYENYFNQADTAKKGIVPGSIARNLFSASGLPSTDLAAIWQLSDMNQDGNLDKIEWCIAMHLIDCKRQRQMEIPSALPKQLLESLGVPLGPSPAELARIKEEQERQQLLALKEEIIKKLKDKSQLLVQLRQQQANNLEAAKNASVLRQQIEILKKVLPPTEIILERQKLRIDIKTEELKLLKSRLKAVQAEKQQLDKTIQLKKSLIKDDEAGLALAKQQLLEERMTAEKEAEKINYIKSDILLAKKERKRKQEEKKRMEKEGLKGKPLESGPVSPDQYYIFYTDDFGTKIGDKSNYRLYFRSYDPNFPPGFYPICNDFSDAFTLQSVIENITTEPPVEQAPPPDFNPFAIDDE